MQKFYLKPTQARFLSDFLSLKYKFLLYAGVANSGKSYTVARLMLMLATDFPNSRFGVVRKNLTTARRTIWHTYMKALSDLGIPYKANLVDSRFDLSNGSRIEIVEADKSKDPDWNKLKGMEVTAWHLEEVNEIEREAVGVMTTRMGRWNENGCPAFIAMTCNPSPGWVRDEFYEPSMNGTLKDPFYFIMSYKDEMPEEYRATMQYLPDNERNRYLEGSWDYSDDPQQLIKYEWIKQCALVDDIQPPTMIGVDVARYGSDKTALAYRSGNDIVKLELLDKQDTTQVADYVLIKMKEYAIGYSRVIVDSIGVGGGVVDSLKSRSYPVRSFNSSEAPTEKPTELEFKNFRAQAFWNVRELFRTGKARIVNNVEAIKQLINIRYLVKNGVIYIESKEEIKKRMGYSPDLADAVAMVYSMNANVDSISTGGNIFNKADAMLKLRNNRWNDKASRFNF